MATKKSEAIPPAKHAHAQKITHRSPTGQFKNAPPPSIRGTGKGTPETLPARAAELEQDPGGGYNTNDDEIQQ